MALLMSEVGRPLDTIRSMDMSWPPSLPASLSGSVDMEMSHLDEIAISRDEIAISHSSHEETEVA